MGAANASVHKHMDKPYTATSRPVIALLTDFGYRDAYAGLMKGVILSHCGAAQILDLTHGVPPQDVLGGALQLLGAAPFCPAGTVFVAVVDPGVGGARRPICIASGGSYFVGPDNGLLWPAACSQGTPQAFHLDRPQFWLPQTSATFHGRDIFSPVAGRLAAGQSPHDLGTAISDPVTLDIPRPTRIADHLAGEIVQGEIIYIDHFGNAVTNFTRADLEHPEPGTLMFSTRHQRVTGPATHYGAVPEGAPAVVLGSFGYYEIAVNRGSAAEALGLQRGTEVMVSPAAPAND